MTPKFPNMMNIETMLGQTVLHGSKVEGHILPKTKVSLDLTSHCIESITDQEIDDGVDPVTGLTLTKVATIAHIVGCDDHGVEYSIRIKLSSQEAFWFKNAIKLEYNKGK